MKKLITILLACSLGFAAGAGAKQDVSKAKKAAPQTGPVQKQNIGPKHVEKIHPQHNVNLKSTKVHQTNVSGPRLKKSTTLPASKITPNNQKTVVAPNLKPIPNVQNIQAKYRNFKAQPKPAVIPSAQFNQNYQIAGAQNWTGPQYQVFASYRPQWHDQGWWQANYAANLVLIAGGWYYWNAGYWYPAWGYDSAYSYYPYDGPIYVGEHRRPFDEVVADVQASLQEQGYYRGEVDGLMGPLTREALADFQRDHGLITTAALDQPTLSSLGLG